MDRRTFTLSLLTGGLVTGAMGQSACAGGDGPHGGGTAQADLPEMLFISPMGEPFRAHPPAPYPVVDWFKGADKNADGKLDLDEFLADAERFFHVLDINKDGMIDHREIFYYEHRIVPEMIGQAYEARRSRRSRLWLAQYSPGGMGGVGGMGGAPMTGGDGASKAPDGGRLGDKDAPLIGAAAFGLLADPEPVQGSDIRLSGLISLGDFKTRARQRFEILDNDQKGYLTLAALPETEAQKATPHHGAFQRGLRGRST